MTAANLVFVIFLSLKNTPLAILTAYSYEKLNFFHQVAGYSLIACTMSHTVVMLVAVSLLGLSSFLISVSSSTALGTTLTLDAVGKEE